MKSKAAVRRIVEALKTLYPDALCSLQYQKDYELLFAVRLSAQCTDARVNMVTPALFARYPTAAAYAQADRAELEALIQPTGFFRVKADTLVKLGAALVDQFAGEVPRRLEQLVTS